MLGYWPRVSHHQGSMNFVNFCGRYGSNCAHPIFIHRAEAVILRHITLLRRYSRKPHGPLDSSGFEHVFVGEVKNGQVIGCHNWIQIYNEERKGKLNYRCKQQCICYTCRHIISQLIFGRRGHYAPHGRATNSMHALTVMFDWLGVSKTIGGNLIGTSPEFEVALFTMAFLSGFDACAFIGCWFLGCWFRSLSGWDR